MLWLDVLHLKSPASSSCSSHSKLLTHLGLIFLEFLSYSFFLVGLLVFLPPSVKFNIDWQFSSCLQYFRLYIDGHLHKFNDSLLSTDPMCI